MIPRRTLINQAHVRGTGLFSGTPCTARFSAAPADTGIVFIRADLPGSPQIRVGIPAIAEPPPGIPARNTTLRTPGGAEVLTVEHALSALSALGITDALIHLDGPELPIGDGSSEPFAAAIWAAGLRYLGIDLPPLIIPRPISVSGRDGARITATPRSRPGCSYTYDLDYGAAAPIPMQTASFDTLPLPGKPAPDQCASSARDVAPARTFCTQAEAEAMQKAGLFKHLTTRDMLVIGPRGPIDNAYRFDNEPARHKLLDLIGDLALVGRPIQADIHAHKSGHALNHEMARALAGVA